jgi:CheY-like chemotaxis protein
VIANLLANAAIYSPPESVVALFATKRDHQVIIRIVDHGDGIDPKLQPKIFDLFVQSEQKIDRARGGLGVGLSLARTIVELHDGTIAVRSEGSGKGSEFVVTLPLGTPRPVSVSIPPVLRGAPCRIVVVDDQEDSREMLRIVLEARRHVVYDAADGERAIQLIEEQKPDIAFIDIGLPVMDGFEVARSVRKRHDLKRVKLVALSGYGTKRDVEAALSAGFDEHVTKPAEVDKLERILARVRPET